MTTPTTQSFFVLELGEGWFTERAGGLNRFYWDLLRHLPRTGAEVRGLVVGTLAVSYESGGQVSAFVRATAPLSIRWWRERCAVNCVLARN